MTLWEHMKPEDKTKVTIKGKKAQFIDPKRVSYIIEEVAYWRKANQIHAWFVKNCQDGQDDCKDYQVSTEQLTELLSLCDRVLEASELIDGKINNGQQFQNGEWVDVKTDGKYIKDPTLAQELLPTESAFSFDSNFHALSRAISKLLKKVSEREGSNKVLSIANNINQ